MKKLIAVLASIGAVIAFLIGWLLRGAFDGKAEVECTHKKHEEVKRAIENTPADTLVNTAADADKLRADTAGIAERARQQFRDRAAAVLSGNAGNGTNGSGGRRD